MLYEALAYFFFFFFFNDTATTEIYTLSLHDALPICRRGADGIRPDGEDVRVRALGARAGSRACGEVIVGWLRDRKSTRLNSSHLVISYAVFCLKKKKKTRIHNHPAYTIPS